LNQHLFREIRLKSKMRTYTHPITTPRSRITFKKPLTQPKEKSVRIRAHPCASVCIRVLFGVITRTASWRDPNWLNGG